MDLLFIVGGMGVGAFVGWFALLTMFPNGSNEFYGVGAIVGGIVGVLLGYLTVWQAKQAQLAKKRPKQVVTRRQIPPQVVGSLCARCGQRMMIITDGRVCPSCGRVFCLACEAESPCSLCRARGHTFQQR